MKTTARKLTGPARLAFIAALFASRAIGVSAPTRYDMQDELARVPHTADGDNSPDVDREDMGTPEVVEHLFDAEPAEELDAILSDAQRAKAKQALRAYREHLYRVALSDASADAILNA